MKREIIILIVCLTALLIALPFVFIQSDSKTNKDEAKRQIGVKSSAAKSSGGGVSFLPAAGSAGKAQSVSSAAEFPSADKNWLVAVGINEFDDKSVNSLRFCKADAETVHAYFTASGLAPASKSYLLVTGSRDAGFSPTRKNILKAVKYAADGAGPESTILLFLAGHGFVDASGKSYLLPQDGDTGVLEETAVSLAWVNETLSASKSKRKVLFVDACRNAPLKESRAMMSTRTEVFLRALKTSAGQVTLASCGRGESSMEDPEKGHGVYTWYLLEGLKGAAADTSGLITVDSLQKYLSDAVPSWCRQKFKPVQTPWISGEMMGGQPIPLAVAGQKVDLSAVSSAASAAGDAGAAGASGSGSRSAVLEALLEESRQRQGQGGSGRMDSRNQVAEAMAKFTDLEREFGGAEPRDAVDARMRAEAYRLYVQLYATSRYRITEAEQKATLYEAWAAGKRPKERPGGVAPEKNFTVALGPEEKIEMMWIPGGTFLIGSDATEEGRNDNEGPQAEVQVKDFWISRFEITQKQYTLVMRTNPSNSRGDDQPVERVTWQDAMAFCREFGKIANRNITLPTEAQWEYACRARTTKPFHLGQTIATAQANYDGHYAYGMGSLGQYRGRPSPVGSFEPNGFGLYDMHGNVWEWCLSSFKKYPYQDGDGRNRASLDGAKVLRGGSWLCAPQYCRSATRHTSPPTFAPEDFGFRVCCPGD